MTLECHEFPRARIGMDNSCGNQPSPSPSESPKSERGRFFGMCRDLRVRRVRDAIVPYIDRAKPLMTRYATIGAIGDFSMVYTVPGWSLRSEFTLELWPPGDRIGGVFVPAYKVLNVAWDPSGYMNIRSLRGGPWEERLFTLLAFEKGIAFVPLNR